MQKNLWENDDDDIAKGKSLFRPFDTDISTAQSRK